MSVAKADAPAAMPVLTDAQVYSIVESAKGFEETAAALAEAVPKAKFGVQHVHNIGETLRNKGQPFAEECKVFEVCNPVKAFQVLSQDMRLNMALPCRISVWTEGGKVWIGQIKPSMMLSMMPHKGADLTPVATEVEAILEAIIAEAAAAPAPAA